MPTDEKAMAAASQAFGQANAQRREKAAARLREAAARDPRIGEIADEMRLAGLAAVRAAAEGSPEEARSRVEEAAARDLALQEERGKRLAALGYPADYLFSGPFCPICGDTGYNGGRLCACFRPFYTQALLDQFNAAAGKGCPAFDEGFFEKADAVPDPKDFLERCRQYASRFAGTGENLLLRGGPGRGKTMLAAYIGREAIRRGTEVLYVSAPDYFALREEERFRRDAEAGAEADRYRRCTALVLDDLGLETQASGSAAELLSLLGAREAAGRPTVLCTALGARELEQRYSGAAASRLENGFMAVELHSGDLRRVFRTAF